MKFKRENINEWQGETPTSASDDVASLAKALRHAAVKRRAAVSPNLRFSQRSSYSSLHLNGRKDIVINYLSVELL